MTDKEEPDTDILFSHPDGTDDLIAWPSAAYAWAKTAEEAMQYRVELRRRWISGYLEKHNLPPMVE